MFLTHVIPDYTVKGYIFCVSTVTFWRPIMTSHEWTPSWLLQLCVSSIYITLMYALPFFKWDFLLLFFYNRITNLVENLKKKIMNLLENISCLGVKFTRAIKHIIFNFRFIENVKMIHYINSLSILTIDKKTYFFLLYQSVYHFCIILFYNLIKWLWGHQQITYIIFCGLKVVKLEPSVVLCS